jgi:tetratricopeptide (TPR) repeat protein
MSGDPALAADLAGQAFKRYRAADDEEGMALALNNIAWASLTLDDHAVAIESCRNALALLTPAHRSVEASARDTLGLALLHTGRTTEAIQELRRAASLFHTVDSRPFEPIALDHLGDAHAARGLPDDTRLAHESWTQAATLLDQLGDPDAEVVRGKLRQIG